MDEQEVLRKPVKLKLVLLSDTHAAHRNIQIPDGDILIHAGDLLLFSKDKILEDFNDFLGTLPHRYKIVIAGNHDSCFQTAPEASRARLTNAIYLQDEEVTLEGIKFYGSPWQPWFGNMAFNLPRGAALRQKWELIPPDVDVLITHTPPFLRIDKCILQPWKTKVKRAYCENAWERRE